MVRRKRELREQMAAEEQASREEKSKKAEKMARVQERGRSGSKEPAPALQKQPSTAEIREQIAQQEELDRQARI